MGGVEWRRLPVEGAEGEPGGSGCGGGGRRCML